MRVVELAVVYDQLNITELASFELLMRRAQMTEYRYCEKLLGSVENALAEDEHLYLGASETRGMLMLAPELEER
eukprot:2068948-Lingulodinium_polyedra.AAC.1